LRITSKKTLLQDQEEDKEHLLEEQKEKRQEKNPTKN